jgi:hypothetical protein
MAPSRLKPVPLKALRLQRGRLEPQPVGPVETQTCGTGFSREEAGTACDYAPAGTASISTVSGRFSIA